MQLSDSSMSCCYTDICLEMAGITCKVKQGKGKAVMRGPRGHLIIAFPLVDLVDDAIRKC